MRRMIAVLIATATVMAAAPGFAQDEEPVKTRFYEMGELVIDGGIRSPLDTVYMHHGKPQFARLLSLKKSFLPKIAETAKESGTR